MIKQFWRSFAKEPPSQAENLSLPALIWETRRYARLSLVLLWVSMVLTTLTYCTVVWPVFFEPTVANPAVMEFIGADSFRSHTEQMFRALERYNGRGPNERIPKPTGFHASGEAQLGVYVQADYQLVHRESIDPTAADDRSGLPQYGYSPKYTIRLVPLYLFVYALVILLQLAYLINIVSSRRERQKHDDRLLESLQDQYISHLGAEAGPPEQAELLAKILGRFHSFAKQIATRYDGRQGMEFVDEYDVQDALHALLRLHFLDVRPEEYTPSYAGKSSRMDFLINDEEIVVEAKMTRKNLKDKEIGDQLLIDIGRYKTHPKCKTLICFIYDPEGLLTRPHALITDLEASAQSEKMRVRVVVSPQH